MDDLKFENEFREKLRKELIEHSKKFSFKSNKEFANPYVPEEEITYDNLGVPEYSTEIKQIVKLFDEALIEYYNEIYGDTKTFDEIYDGLCIPFMKEFTEQELYETYNNTEFSQEELYYMQLQQLRYNHTNNSVKYATTEILLRKKVIEKFGESSLDKFINITKDLMHERKGVGFQEMYNHIKKLFSDKPYGENVKEEYENEIEKKATYEFNEKINCGGYALKIENWVEPPYQENFYKNVSSLLNKIPFIRLLGDKPLKEDEYLVIYITNAKKIGNLDGHHFIRIDSDGTVREKDGNKEPKVFENREGYENCKGALLAVKKEHPVFLRRTFWKYNL